MPPDLCSTFLITVTASPGRQRVDLVLSGNVDLPARRLLADAVNELAAAAPHAFVVDLAAMTYGGSVLVNFLARVHKAVPVGSVLLVCRPTPFTYQVLKMADIGHIAPIREDQYA